MFCCWVKLRFRGEYEHKSGEIYIVDIVTERLIKIKMPCLLHSFHIIKKKQMQINTICHWPLALLDPGGEELGETAVFAGYINPFFCGLGSDSSVVCTTGVPVIFLLINQTT